MIEMQLHTAWIGARTATRSRSSAAPRHRVTFSMAISSEEGRALSPVNGQTSTQLRLCERIQALLGGLEARLSGVTFSVTNNNVLAAILQIESPRVTPEVQVQATDGLILARLYAVPLRMTEYDLARTGHARPEHTHGAAAPAPAVTAAQADPLAPFRRAFEDRDFDSGPTL